jgi:hypothetical protein
MWRSLAGPSSPLKPGPVETRPSSVRPPADRPTESGRVLLGLPLLIPWDAIPRTGRGTASRTATGYTVTIAGFGNSWSRRSAQAFVESCEACGKPIKDGSVSRRRFGKHDLPADQVFALDGGSQTDEKRPEASACWGDACQCTAVSEHRPSFGCSQPCIVFSDRSWITWKPLSI